MPLGAVLDERVLLGHRAQVDAVAQVLHRLEVLAPADVDDLQDQVALDLAHELGAVAPPPSRRRRRARPPGTPRSAPRVAIDARSSSSGWISVS